MPTDDSNWAMRAPGDTKVHGLEFAANLLDVAIWTLCEQRLVEIEQLRPYEVERAGGVMGGSSFVRLTLVDPSATRPGLEGALLDAAREQAKERGRAGRMVDRVVNRLSGDDERGLRGIVRTLDIHGAEPWVRVAGYCLGEAASAGLAKAKGRMLPKPVITNQAAVEELQPRLAESRAARRAYREREEELDNAVLADCIQALHWSHHTPD
jgi:hypothetical protein